MPKQSAAADYTVDSSEESLIGVCGNVCPNGGCVAGSCTCQPQTCVGQCGVVPDGCGGTINCGGCVATQVATGQYHACGLRPTGEVRCWGNNANGEIGDGTTLDRYTATVVSGLSGAIKIAASESHTCALLQGGTINYGWTSHFAVVPAVSYDVGYRFWGAHRVTVGYQFQYLSRAARGTDALCTLADPTRNPLAGGSGFWAQGLTLGLEFRY